MKTNKLNSLNRTHKASNLRGLISFVSISIFTAITLYLSSSNQFWIWLPSQLTYSLLLWAWFSIFHSCGHQAYFKNSYINAFVGLVASLLVIAPFYAWKYYHSAHHKWTGWGDKDPSIKDFSEKPLSPSLIKLVDLCRMVFFPVFTIFNSTGLFLKSFRMDETINTRKKLLQCSLSSAFVMITYTVLFICFGTLILKLILLPFCIMLITSDLAFISQHALFEFEHSAGKEILPLPTSKQDAYTRSFRVHPLIDRWVFLNFNLHGVHHLYPNVPHYHLHKIDFTGTHEMSLFTWIKTARSVSCKELFWPENPHNKNRNQVP